MTSPGPRPGGVLAAPVLLLVLAACGGEAPQRTLEGPAGAVSCPDVISDQTTDALGWPVRPQAPEAEVVEGRCERSLPGVGVITVDVVGGGSGCAAGLPQDTQTGLAEIVLVTADDVVLQVRVDAGAPVVPAKVAGGLHELVRAAQQAW